jgi:CheY-like chemotaxis protein
MRKQVRILVADDQHEVRSALRFLLEQERGLYIVAEAVDAQELVARTTATSPDLVLLDWELPGLKDGTLAALRRTHPGLRVVALSGRPEARRAALAAGADAFVSKANPPERLLAAIEIEKERRK